MQSGDPKRVATSPVGTTSHEHHILAQKISDEVPEFREIPSSEYEGAGVGRKEEIGPVHLQSGRASQQQPGRPEEGATPPGAESAKAGTTGKTKGGTNVTEGLGSETGGS